MSWNSSLKRKTPLKAKAIAWATRKLKKTDETVGLVTEVIVAVAERAGGRCEYCKLPFSFEPEFRRRIHHVFYRSHVWEVVRHETWNLVALHDLCHKKAHEVPAIRMKLETIAIQRLYIQLGPDNVKAVIAYQKGSTHRSFIRAYECWRRWNLAA